MTHIRFTERGHLIDIAATDRRVFLLARGQRRGCHLLTNNCFRQIYLIYIFFFFRKDSMNFMNSMNDSEACGQKSVLYISKVSYYVGGLYEARANKDGNQISFQIHLLYAWIYLFTYLFISCHVTKYIYN